MKKKITITIICAVLSCVCLIGTTFAWLVDKTDPIENTFTVGDVDIDLSETKGTITDGKRTFKMVPGNEIDKDPLITVNAGSEACYVFVKIDKSTNFDTFLTYELADGWTELQTGVYYRTVNANIAQAGTTFGVLKDDVVKVKTDVTRELLQALADATYPTLTFTAYAVQSDNVADAATAWAIANPTP